VNSSEHRRASDGEAAARDVYRVSHHWRIEGTIEAVYYHLTQARTYPVWWPAIPAVDVLVGGDDVAIGNSVRMHVKSFLPYHIDWVMTTTRLEPPEFVETDNQLILGGRWRLSGSTTVRLRQDSPLVEVVQEEVLTADGWHLPGPLRALAARVFQLNHTYAARAGERGLQRLIRAGDPSIQ
jgi:uncharacterized protein YndB with AHSA1/START domain